MIALVFAMILCLVLGLAVVGLVAIPARRAGRGVLTPRGEKVVGKVRERTESVASVTKGKTEVLVTTTRRKASNATSREQPLTGVETREAS